MKFLSLNSTKKCFFFFKLGRLSTILFIQHTHFVHLMYIFFKECILFSTKNIHIFQFLYTILYI